MNDATKKDSKEEIEIDFSIDDELKIENNASGTKDRISAPLAGIELNSGSEENQFSLDIEFDSNGNISDIPDNITMPSIRKMPKSRLPNEREWEANSKESLSKNDESDLFSENRIENSQKTIIVDSNNLEELELGSGQTILSNISYDNEFNKNAVTDNGNTENTDTGLIATEQSNADIKSTILDILGTPETDSTDSKANAEAIQAKDFIEIDHDQLLNNFHEDEATRFLANKVPTSKQLSGSFDLNSVISIKSAEIISYENKKNSIEEKNELMTKSEDYSVKNQVAVEKIDERDGPRDKISIEGDLHVQSTLRALREEREDLINQMRSLKDECRETREENLLLRASLEESMLEISIIRKNKISEFEDIKYRLNLSEEKRSILEEKLKGSELKRQKLEQKVRIDFNQLKAREKELESKLELLMMDSESQIHSREQKILELRRKVELLEFNMENATIREQKNVEDKRKVEDRLIKLTKILKHSLNNIEDDLEFSLESIEPQKDKR